MKQEVEHEIEQLLKAGIIVKSDSVWCMRRL